MAKLDYVFMVLKEHPYGRVTIKLFNPFISSLVLGVCSMRVCRLSGSARKEEDEIRFLIQMIN
jgi:hypothetical protein